ncbi:MAG TPA: hypothetical protein VLV50_15725 [Stellaceae bacterium]|nr:hypothetical protein [Stellaceae bacterium]
MANDLERAKFWQEFICTRCDFPEPEKLRVQFAVASITRFCDCGCNSFDVSVPASADIEPLATKASSHQAAFFDATFAVSEDELQTLEIVLFADENGNLCGVDVMFCANAFPVPDVFDIRGGPFTGINRVLRNTAKSGL